MNIREEKNVVSEYLSKVCLLGTDDSEKSYKRLNQLTLPPRTGSGGGFWRSELFTY